MAGEVNLGRSTKLRLLSSKTVTIEKRKGRQGSSSTNPCDNLKGTTVTSVDGESTPHRYTYEELESHEIGRQMAEQRFLP